MGIGIDRRSLDLSKTWCNVRPPRCRPLTRQSEENPATVAGRGTPSGSRHWTSAAACRSSRSSANPSEGGWVGSEPRGHRHRKRLCELAATIGPDKVTSVFRPIDAGPEVTAPSRRTYLVDQNSASWIRFTSETRDSAYKPLNGISTAPTLSVREVRESGPSQTGWFRRWLGPRCRTDGPRR